MNWFRKSPHSPCVIQQIKHNGGINKIIQKHFFVISFVPVTVAELFYVILSINILITFLSKTMLKLAFIAVSEYVLFIQKNFF